MMRAKTITPFLCILCGLVIAVGLSTIAIGPLAIAQADTVQTAPSPDKATEPLSTHPAKIPQAGSGDYFFTGARNFLTTDVPNLAATAVTCTNFGPSIQTLYVAIVDYDQTYVISNTLPINPGDTRTFGSQNTAIYGEDALLTGHMPLDDINQGYGYVDVSDGAHAQEIRCTAQVLDPLGNPPAYIVQLPMYNANLQLIRPTINHPHWGIYLPNVLKHQ